MLTSVCGVFATEPFGQPEFYQWYLIVAGVWAFNLVFSSIWLRFFAFGPLEWGWRSLTYWKRQPLLIRTIVRRDDVTPFPVQSGV
jgi:uncharacterized membrane protein YeiB